MQNSKGSALISRLKQSIAPFIVLLCFFVVLAAMVIWPLASALAWAAVLSFFTYPLYRFIYHKLMRGHFSYIASGINTFLILFLLVLPMFGLIAAVVRELGYFYQFFVEWFPTVRGRPLSAVLPIPHLDWLLSKYPDFFELPMWSDMAANLPGIITSFMTKLSGQILGNAFQLGFNLLVITVGTFFLTHDGESFARFAREILPLSETEKDVFFSRVKQMLYAIFYGIIMTAGIQAALGGLGWWFVGLSNPVLFGSLMFFLAMLPFVGTPMVMVPGAVYLFASGDVKNAAILLAWSILVVSSIDNLLRPLFIYEETNAHILMIFTGLLGGIYTWGFLGLFMGPLILSVAYFMLRLYHTATFTPEAGMPPADEPDKPNGAPGTTAPKT
ncbi:MAG: AI-2E family transporter [Synergistaceae bacterium]|nr:AI-2E family transporter [Synergistaceae bacterium]MDR1515533.1 AI-2E family transporter [Synergistaceae bacterium]